MPVKARDLLLTGWRSSRRVSERSPVDGRPARAGVRPAYRRAPAGAARRWLTVKIVVSAAAISLIAGYALRPPAERRDHVRTADAAPKFSDDDGGAPLFTVTNLAPGRLVARCTRLTYGGAAQTPVMLTASSAGGTLNEFLELRVQAGSGGSYADCKGFSGEQLFDGSLAEFIDRFGGASGGLSTWTPTAREPERTFRFTLRLRDVAEAQGHSGSVSFEWKVEGDALPARADRPRHSPPASSGPTPPPTPPGSAAPKRGRSTSPRDRSRPTDGRGPADGLTLPRRPSHSSPIYSGGKGEGGLQRALDVVTRVAEDVGKRAAFPFFLVLVAAFFFLIQNRLDRRDPKLALAPIHRVPDLSFGPLPTRAGGRR